ncbi:ribonuclease H1 domain-containing protein [Flavobacteriaceae bacterium 14752]|uniref:ribonuclease H1 domain-containing protein n=1 Tax=Mesohalobacter salilacus TaxID=2491711 RepID=UPI000F643C8A|nr:ribonuclease H [Flavobacteriaceae bacterium 14752]
MAKQKYYVVWDGHNPGIYKTWEDCKLQTKNYPQAKYKSFPNKATAEDAFNMGFYEFQKLKKTKTLSKRLPAEVNLNSICVDAASSGNPGKMEYRGVDTKTQKILFQKGPFEQATNNIGEFLALVHGLGFLKNQNSNRAIYSDSRTAMSWVKKRHCKTTLKQTQLNAEVFELIKRAENWLKENAYQTTILKWDTKSWGEIPADFGRK